MPRFVMKEAPETDYYVEWSTVVEAPTAGGPREWMLDHLRNEHRDPTQTVEQRMERVDETGTSVLWEVEGYPREGSWADGGLIYMQRGVVRDRGAIFELTRRITTDGNAEVTDLLVPFDDAAEVRPAP